MKRMAQVDTNGVVINIIVSSDDWNADGFVEYTDDNPAYIGGTYGNGKFISPKPTPNAVLDEATCQWVVPIEDMTIQTIFADTLGADSA